MSDHYIITERLLQTGLVSCASFHTFITIFTGKWIAFEPLSILIKLPLLWGVRTVKCLIQTVNYNTTHYFSLFNYLHFHWLEQPSSHPGWVTAPLTRDIKGWPGQHTLPAHAEPGKPWESFHQQEKVFLGRWNERFVIMQGRRMEIQSCFLLPLLMLVTKFEQYKHY